MKFSADDMLHKLADKGFALLTNIIRNEQLKSREQAPAFKPMELSKLLRPHPIWYIRRYEKRIIETGLLLGTALTILVLVIKNWR